MKELDAYYTPPYLAHKLINYVESPASKVVDFCVGNGDLLKAAEQLPGVKEFYGTDISESAVSILKSVHKYWKLAVADFVNKKSISNIPWAQKGLFDLILMNPPFTCKGSKIHKYILEDQEYHVSTAMYFLLHALEYMDDSSGCIYAIMPISCVKSRKDSKAWYYLMQNYHACVLEECANVQFGNCTPNVALVYVSKKQEHTRANNQVVSYGDTFKGFHIKECIRGKISATTISYPLHPSSIYFLHTTNLQNGEIVNMRTIDLNMCPYIQSAGVVFPRVCKPNVQKIALLDYRKKYVLSDCVISILTEDTIEAKKVMNAIVKNWNIFKKIYSGTGAQYTAMNTVKELFGVA